MLALQEIEQRLREHCPGVLSIAPLHDGRLIRVETGLQYPDGSQIDVFVTSVGPLLDGVATAPQLVRLSDLGHTTGWLLDMNIRPWHSRKRVAFVEDVIAQYGAKQDGGAFVLDCKPEHLAIGVLRLAQVCLRVADLTFTRRAFLQTAFSEDVEELLSDAEINYERDVELHGRSGPIRVDYLVHGRQRESAILGLSATNPASAHNAANEIFRRWYDLTIVPTNRFQPVTLFDDRENRVQYYRLTDLKALEEFSVVVPFSEKDQVIQTLAA